MCGLWLLHYFLHIVLRIFGDFLEVGARQSELLPMQEPGMTAGKCCFRLTRHCGSVAAFILGRGTRPKCLLLVLKGGCYFLAGIKLCSYLAVCGICHVSQLYEQVTACPACGQHMGRGFPTEVGASQL